jgi:adenylate cyclase
LLKKHNGIISSVNESKIVALFGTDDILGHADKASFCALECLELIADFSKRWSQDHGDFSLNIGIDSGDVIMGNFGSTNGLYFNILGQPVKTAELLARKMIKESRILITEFAQKELGSNFEFNALDQILIKGLLNPVGIYELLETI